ncbi:hypothetical protein J6590_058227 [Homalodisca vitripennis]|nr:hypothetical protein J6590_058227 [Homalodisca vitripennis]
MNRWYMKLPIQGDTLPAMWHQERNSLDSHGISFGTTVKMYTIGNPVYKQRVEVRGATKDVTNGQGYFRSVLSRPKIASHIVQLFRCQIMLDNWKENIEFNP